MDTDAVPTSETNCFRKMCFTVQKRAGCREAAGRKEEKKSGDAFGRLTSMSSQSRDPEPYCSRHWCTALYRTPGSTEFQECLSFTGASSRHQPQPRLGGGEREREREVEGTMQMIFLKKRNCAVIF